MLPEAWNVEHNNLHHYKLGYITVTKLEDIDWSVGLSLGA
jgi:hypothetical protein